MSVLNKIGRGIIKNADKICIGFGIIGVGLGVGVACKDTMSGIDEVNQIKVDLCEKDYIPAAKRFGKVYWPSFLIIGGSLVMIIGGHRILVKRYAGLVVAYEGLNKTYKDYRGFIKNNYGEDVDFNARHTSDFVQMNKENEIVSTFSYDSDKQNDIFIPDRDLSDFAVFFGKDYSEILVTDDPEEALNVLKSTEEWANAVFEEQGYIFLQDIYFALGLDKFAPDGVGWCKGIGDDFVDFGIYNVRNGRAVNGTEPVFLLDFNHDGYILPYM